jgi:hypothetical protein
MERQACWADTLAVGSAPFFEKFKPEEFSRRETETVEAASGM